MCMKSVCLILNFLAEFNAFEVKHFINTGFMNQNFVDRLDGIKCN